MELTVIEVHFLIPVSDNAGATFTPATDDAFLLELDRLFGGSSRLPGLVAGRWQSSGTVYQDQNRVFMVFVNGLLADGAKIVQATEFAKANYAQLAVTVRYLGHAEIL